MKLSVNKDYHILNEYSIELPRMSPFLRDKVFPIDDNKKEEGTSMFLPLETHVSSYYLITET